MRLVIILVVLTLICCTAHAGTTYYVSPKGDDGRDGQSAATAWKSCAKVNAAKFAPGDQILFECGGEWREQLKASSSGAENNPIAYKSYGKGPAPRFLGSDLLVNASFKSAGNDTYTYAIAARADAALRDHLFIESKWENGTLTITVPGGNPVSDGKVYTACTRGNVVFSNAKDHLVYDNLVADETAGELFVGVVQGYGFRIENSADVVVSNCEANRCGRHNFGVINSTGFVGTHLKASYAAPKIKDGNTFYVSFADQSPKAPKCTSTWSDISAEHMEDGAGGKYLFFVSHGDKLGLITMEKAVSPTKISFMSSPVLVKNCTLTEGASIENWGPGVMIDSVNLLDSAAIDQWAVNGTIQNCIFELTPKGGGPTGYSTAIVLRGGAKNTVIRFNTLVTGRFSCLAMAGNNAGTKWCGNIALTNGNVFGQMNADDMAYADYNFYGANAKSGGDWKGKEFDTHSLNGDPKFGDAAKHEFWLQPGSPAIGAAKVEAALVPKTDFNGCERPSVAANIGAVQRQSQK